jgi:hypothetical protein
MHGSTGAAAAGDLALSSGTTPKWLICDSRVYRHRRPAFLAASDQLQPDINLVAQSDPLGVQIDLHRLGLIGLGVELDVWKRGADDQQCVATGTRVSECSRRG